MAFKCHIAFSWINDQLLFYDQFSNSVLGADLVYFDGTDCEQAEEYAKHLSNQRSALQPLKSYIHTLQVNLGFRNTDLS